jgi:SET domain-containing protein
MARAHSIHGDGIRVGSAGKLGRGVFATKQFYEGDLIEHAPIIVLGDDIETTLIENYSVLGNYTYDYDGGRSCIALGFASLYNHSTRPNAFYEVLKECIQIVALRDIRPGTQIRVNYNGDPKDKTVWTFK